jgi:fructose-bisphosphate aldolase, class II
MPNNMTILRKVLQKAYAGKYAVGAFNTSNLEITQAILNASQKLNAPVIVATSPKAIDYAGGPRVIVALVEAVAKKYRIPIVLHLDHSKTFSLVKACIEAGYTSVMFDGSRLPYAQNVRITKNVVKAAHSKGVSVEAEIGIIGGKEDYLNKRSVVLADPDQAVDFVKKTGVDALAAAVGTAHGLAKDAPEKIDFKLLAEINKRLRMPLVLHGASEGISNAHIRKAIRSGVSKINIDTTIRVGFTNAVRKSVIKDKELYDPRALITSGRIGAEKAIEQKIKLFSTQNKAR